MTLQKKLDALWKDPDDVWPFNPNVNEQLILDAITELHSDTGIDSNTCDKIKQWIKFNKFINKDEDNEFQTFVYQIYSKIELLINTEYDENTCDDSPEVSDSILVNELSAYKRVLNCILKDDYSLSANLVYTAYCDIIRSNDDNKANCLEYFLSSSLPSEFSNGKDPLGVLVAKQTDDKRLYDMLLVLKSHNPDMLDEENCNRESANTILKCNNETVFNILYREKV